jgi:hypothetical protein
MKPPPMLKDLTATSASVRVEEEEAASIASSLGPIAVLRGSGTIHQLAPRTCSWASNSSLCKAQFLGAT